MDTVDEQVEDGNDEPEDAVDDVAAEDRQPPSEDEAKQDNYANTDDQES